MSQPQLGRGPLRDRQPGPTPPAPDEETPDGSPPARFVGWLGGLGAAAAGYGVFQFLFSVLPDSIDGSAAPVSDLRSQRTRHLRRGLAGGGAAAGSDSGVRGARAGPRRGPCRDGAGCTRPAPPVFASAYGALVDQVSVVDDPEHGRLTGWPHSLGENSPSRPTPVGTAYGLHIMLDLGVPDGRLSTGDLVDTLWRLRLPGGGWSARSQGSEARPEVTALVLGALARAGTSAERLAAEVDRCSSAFTRNSTAPGWSRRTS